MGESVGELKGSRHVRVELNLSKADRLFDHNYLTGGFTANTSLALYCRDNGLLLHIHRAMHAVIDRQRNHGIHFRVLAKTLRMSGGDHLHSGTVVGKLEGEREVTLGFVDLMRDPYIEKDRSRGIYFTQDWCGMGGTIPVASGGIHVWHMPALTEIFGDDACLQFGGGTLGHPWGNAVRIRLFIIFYQERNYFL